MTDDRPMWMRLATLRHDSCISAHYSMDVLRFMHSWLDELSAASIAEGYLPMVFEALQILEEELAAAEEAIESDDWMPEWRHAD